MYEDLISDTEQVSRDLLEFCGLEWDEQCLRFFENDRDVGTASYEQIRKPIYINSISRWKNYQQHLAPFNEALDRSWPAC